MVYFQGRAVKLPGGTSAVTLTNWTPNANGLGEIIMASAMPGVSLMDLPVTSFPPKKLSHRQISMGLVYLFLNLPNVHGLWHFNVFYVGRLMVKMSVQYHSKSLLSFTIWHKKQNTFSLFPKHVMFATRRNNFCDSGPSTEKWVFSDGWVARTNATVTINEP